MAKKLENRLKSYRKFLFRTVLCKLEENTHKLGLLKYYTEEDDLYEFIFEDNNDMTKIVSPQSSNEFLEILEYLLKYYEDDQQYEKCQNIYKMMDQWSMY